MLRQFVILEHDHPFLHWDLMLEDSTSLKTWRLLQFPEPQVWLPAEALPDHRTAYLTYEGPVSGNRGSVKRIFSGSYHEIDSSGFEGRRFQFTGSNLDGLGTLQFSSDSTLQWRFAEPCLH